MDNFRKQYFEKRAELLLKNLRSRHFEAYYCPDRATALEKALDLIPRDASIGWGGAISAQQIGLMDALKSGGYNTYDRDTCSSPEERVRMMKKCLTADVFLTGANAISMDGEMVNIDGMGNRVAAIVYGPDSVIVIAGMNKVTDTLEDAVTRARTVAAPINKQRFGQDTPCGVTGVCADCKSEGCICNQILITRNCRPAGRIKFILVGEELGF
ncbi:MAG: lactate utilization protein [Oscillospiraceae bacterium]|nr:lactate utilization protein [Oscillospiraceae bacterium]MBQ7129515.1 lactate utilization protein [Oscillospiraceae bacterium]